MEILDRDEFACQRCGSTDKTLHVDHTCYQFGKNPWEYPDEHLVTLCVSCHETVHGLRKRLKEVIGLLHTDFFESVYGYALGLLAQQENNKEWALDVCSWGTANGLAQAFDARIDDVIELLNEEPSATYVLYGLRSRKG